MSERELLGIRGELDANWRELVTWIRKYGTKHSDGNVRTLDLADSIDRLEVAIARVEDLARAGRASVAFRPPVPSPLPRFWKTRAMRHALRLHDALHQLHYRRHWFREVFDAWSSSVPDAEALTPLEMNDESDQRRRELAPLIARYRRYVVFTACGYAAVAAFVITAITLSILRS